MFNAEDMPSKTSIAGPSSKTKAFQPDKVIREKPDQTREASKEDTANSLTDPVEGSSSRPRRTTPIIRNGDAVTVECFGGAHKRFIVIADYVKDRHIGYDQPKYVAARRANNKDKHEVIIIKKLPSSSLYREVSGDLPNLSITAAEIKEMLDKNEWKLLTDSNAIVIEDKPTELLATQLPQKRPQKGWKGTKVEVKYHDGSIVNGIIQEEQITPITGKKHSRMFVIKANGKEFMATLDPDRRLNFHSGRVTRHATDKAGCCPPGAAHRVMSPATTEEHVGFDHVDQNSAGLCMPMQPLTGYGGRPMKNLCWVPVVAAISGTNCDEVLTTVYGCTHTSEDCPDERMDPLELLENFYNIPCNDVFTIEDIHKVHQCKEYVADALWKAMKTAVHASKPIVLLAASRSYRGYVHCLMVVGIHENDTQILVTDACERGVFRSEFQPTCPKQIHCTDEEACGSLGLNVYINNKVCEQYRVICVAVF